MTAGGRESRYIVGALLALALLLASPAAARPRSERRDDAERYYRLGVVQFESGRTLQAIEAIEKALDIDPDLAVAHNYLGYIHLQQSDLKAATRAFKRAVATDPYLTDAWNNLGLAYREQGRYERALEAFDRALADKGYRSREKIHLNVGHLHLARGENQEAIRSFEQAVAANPAYLRGILGLGTAYQRSGRPDLAEKELRRVLSLGPQSPEAAEARQILARLTKPEGS